MLKIFNELRPFCEDNYRRIHVRQYAKIVRKSPPTASKILELYKKENLLKSEEDKQYKYYAANNKSGFFRDLSRVYWKVRLEESGCIKMLEQELLFPIVIMFGSLSKAEAKADSDIDIAVFTPSKKEIMLKEAERKLKRKIQLFVFSSREMVKNKDLLNNILNGYIIKGNW